MTASQSDLSDPVRNFGCDLVVAVTQASLDSTMKLYLAGISGAEAPEVVVCAVLDENNASVGIAYEELKARANGADPFSATPPTEQDLKKLQHARFSGAFKARIGLPESWPSVVTFAAPNDKGETQVRFNLLCEEFRIVGILYGPENLWVDQSQTDADPWYFSTHVTLRSKILDPDAAVAKDSKVFMHVQKRVSQLLDDNYRPDQFTIRQLFLDLDTASNWSDTTIEGRLRESTMDCLKNFLRGTYLDRLKTAGAPVLGYTLAMTNPDRSTLELGSLSYAIQPVQENGQRTYDDPASTLLYLGSTSSTPPAPVVFPWNWVEPGEIDALSGVIAVRREVFLGYLASMLNVGLAGMCVDTHMQMAADGAGFNIDYSHSPSPNPPGFQLLSSIGAPDPYGFVEAMAVVFESLPPTQDCGNGGFSIHGAYGYTLNGFVGVGGASGNQLRVVFHRKVDVGFWHTELGIDYVDLPRADYIDQTSALYFTFKVAGGRLLVEQNELVSYGHPPAWNFQPQGTKSMGDFKDRLAREVDAIRNLIVGFEADYARSITQALNDHCTGWAFPAANTFLFNQVAFSAGLDLVAQITYSDRELPETSRASVGRMG